MTLTLSVLRCPPSVPPETRHVPGGEFSMGRGPENDWVLADPDRVLSKRHCMLAFRSGGWQIADLSTNGTYLNRDADALGNGQTRELRDGDRLRLGSYEIEIRIAEDATGGSDGWGAAPAARPARSAFGADPFHDDPFGPPPAGSAFGGTEPPGGHGLGGPSIQLPDDFDPLSSALFAGPTQPDHTPAVSDAFRPPRPVAAIPDDWDLDLSPIPAIGTPQAPAAPPPAPSAPPPPAPILPEPASQAAAAAANPFDLEQAAAPPPVARDLPPPASRDETRSPVPAVEGDLMLAFLHGAGMADAQVDDPTLAMQRLGEGFRALVGGLREALIARASVKGEFRIEQTMIRARRNNPLKFSAGDDDALAALIGIGRRTDMTAGEAIGDALRDMRLHELATMSAMQAAVRALLKRFDPAPLREEGEKAGGLLPAQRRARAFDQFEKLHAEVSAALADDFDSVFGKAFARAYEQAIQEAGDQRAE